MGKLRRAASFTVQMVLVLAMVRMLGLIGLAVAMVLIFVVQAAWKGLAGNRSAVEGKAAP
jgi:hypothetical protein